MTNRMLGEVGVCPTRSEHFPFTMKTMESMRKKPRTEMNMTKASINQILTNDIATQAEAQENQILTNDSATQVEAQENQNLQCD